MAAGDVDVVVSKAHAFKCASFDGVDDYVQIPNKIPNGAYFSISFDFFPKKVLTSDQYIFIINTVGLNNNFYIFNDDTAGTHVLAVGWRRDDSGVDRRFTSTPDSETILTPIWHNITVVIDAVNGNSVLYFDGSSLKTSSSTYSIGSLPTTAYIASYSSPPGTITFGGSIRNLRIWDRPLTPAEVSNVYAGDNSVARNNLVGEWKLQDDYNDTSGNGNHGTNSGSVLQTVEDQIAADIKTLRTTAGATGKFNIVGLTNGGQVITTAITEA